MNSTITDIKLQRWVDGQITSREERELLADCDCHPGQWRRVALAFIEERAMNREFASQFAAEVRLAAKPSIEVTETRQFSPAAGSWLASRNVQQWCAIVATLLLGLFIGNSLNWRWPAPELPNRRLAVQPPAFESGGRNELVSSPMVEYIPDPSRGERYQMPLLDERSAPEHYFDKEVELTGLPPEIALMLKESGIELRGIRDFTSYEIAEGEVIVVPTIRFDLRHAAPPEP